MKNDTIVASWSRVEPDETAEARMLAAILERNREVVRSGGEAGARSAKGLFWRRWAVAACVAVILAIAGAAGLGGKLFGNGEPQRGITIPAITISANRNSAANMIALVVYRGNVYKMSGANSGEGSALPEEMLGEYLGHAAGKIDEWSTTKDDTEEFAATVWGDVYTVKGYDPDFRICVRDEYPSGRIDLYDRLNGVHLVYGRELFEDRLRLGGRVTGIRFQAHDDWNNNAGNVRDAAISKEVWDAFLDAVNREEFIDAQPKTGSFYKDKPGSSIYDTQNQSHLFLKLEDGIVTELRLIEGGYVGYENCFVRIPDNVFNTVYDACEGTH